MHEKVEGLTDVHLAQFHTLLETQRREAIQNRHDWEGRLARLSGPKEDEISQGEIDTRIVTYNMDLEGRKIAQIDRALTRLEKGLYGICRDCGEQISITRLRFDPSVERCVSCMEIKESARTTSVSSRQAVSAFG